MKKLVLIISAGMLALASVTAAFADQPPGQKGYEGQPGNQSGKGGSNGNNGYEGQPGNQSHN